MPQTEQEPDETAELRDEEEAEDEEQGMESGGMKSAFRMGAFIHQEQQAAHTYWSRNSVSGETMNPADFLQGLSMNTRVFVDVIVNNVLNNDAFKSIFMDHLKAWDAFINAVDKPGWKMAMHNKKSRAAVPPKVINLFHEAMMTMMLGSLAPNAEQMLVIPDEFNKRDKDKLGIQLTRVLQCIIRATLFQDKSAKNAAPDVISVAVLQRLVGVEEYAVPSDFMVSFSLTKWPQRQNLVTKHNKAVKVWSSFPDVTFKTFTDRCCARLQQMFDALASPAHRNEHFACAQLIFYGFPVFDGAFSRDLLVYEIPAVAKCSLDQVAPEELLKLSRQLPLPVTNQSSASGVTLTPEERAGGTAAVAAGSAEIIAKVAVPEERAGGSVVATEEVDQISRKRSRTEAHAADVEGHEEQMTSRPRTASEMEDMRSTQLAILQALQELNSTTQQLNSTTSAIYQLLKDKFADVE